MAVTLLFRNSNYHFTRDFPLSQPTFAVAVTFQIHPEHVDAFVTRVRQQARDSISLEPGCHQFDVLVDENDPATVFLYETYTDAAAFVDHRATPHFADFDQQVQKHIASKQVVRLNLLSN